MSIFDLEEQMQRAEAAQARVDAHNPARLLARPDREQHRAAMRTIQLHDTPALHDWLRDLEDQCLTLAQPANGSP